VSLTLYWQRTGKLDAGWKLFTHLLDTKGRQIAQFDTAGPLRAGSSPDVQALGPSDWEIGKIYVDKLNFRIPRTLERGDKDVRLESESVIVAVGVWKDRARLDVLGGAADAHRRGYVTTLKTGIKPEARVAPEPENKKAADG
jgi:hypothetical protein